MIKYTVYFSKIDSYDQLIFLWDNNTSDSDMQIYDATLDLEDCTAGSFEFSIAPNHPYFDYMTIRNTIIHIYRNNEWLWEGRIMSVEENFYKERKIYCEGALAYLNDTIQDKKTYTLHTLRQLLEELLKVHNMKVNAPLEEGKKAYNDIELGYIRTDVDDTQTEFEVDYDTTLSFVNKLVEDNGGHIYITKDTTTGEKKLEWKTDEQLNHAIQTIDFGVNLLDYTNTREFEEFCTVVMPLGQELDEETGERLTCSEANENSPYIVSPYVSAYGWYESILDLEDVDDPAKLKELGEEYLNTQFNGGLQDFNLEVTAIDMAYLATNDEI